MATQFIKNGKLVSHPFAGMSYDLKRLTQDQGTHLSVVIMEIKTHFYRNPEVNPFSVYELQGTLVPKKPTSPLPTDLDFYPRWKQ